MKQIKITITVDNEVTVEAIGFKGKACESKTKAIIDALGVAGTSKKKPEYYATESATQKVGAK